MSSEPAIHVQALSKRYEIYEKPQDRLKQMLARERRQFYREFWALRDVEFSISKGETVGIIGRNGSGKSTLLQMICGTLTPTAGTIETRGRIAALLELGAGFNPEFSGRDNIMLNASIMGLSNAEIKARMPDIIAFSELTDFIDQPVKTFSSGMYARLAFSVAINVDPDILIVDETLAVGDARFVAKCMRRIKRIQTEGATILFVSHDVSSVRTLCERAIWLDNGKMVEDGNVFPVTGRYVEYMFKDDSPQSDVISLENEDEPHRETFAGLVAADSERSPEHEEPYNRAPLPRPITHWGSHKGLIQSAFLKSETYGLNSDVLSYGEYMEITIELDIPETITRECLAVAVSIKDLKGTDLIVSTTQDLNHTVLPREERFSVTFRLKNMLAAGQFLLVAAVERRSLLDCHYYEYIEGIRYFSSVSDSRLFGIFHPDVLRNIAVHQ